MSNQLYVNLEWLQQAPKDFNNQLQAANNHDVPGAQLYRLAGYALDINQSARFAKVIAKLQKRSADLTPLIPFKLGVVSNSTTAFLVPALVASAARFGFALTVLEAPYDQAMQVALGQIPAFLDMNLDMILLAIDYKGLPIRGNSAPFGQDVEAVHQSLGYINLLRSRLSQRYTSPCIIQNCVQMPESYFGSFDLQVHNTTRQFINAYNLGLGHELVGSSDFLLDVAAIAETVGLAVWHDPVMYHLAKMPFAQLLVPLYAEHVCRIIAATQGKSRRALVLDLDNTLWGGVIGDDGLSGISLGQGNPVGEAYLAIQNMALTLRDRGIVLAVSSKNDDATARLPFREHSEMLLKEEHIAVFQANWQDKASNISAIAKSLNLGLESIVFLDDNPVERDLVQQHLPQVAIPCLPEDPALYPRTLLAAGYFETVHFSTDDRQRVQDYQVNAQRVALLEQAADLDSYLKTLQMQAQMQTFNEQGINRIVQLISKSNQFNLTTRRHNENQVRKFMQSERFFTLQIRLADSFGDSGMVSVVICEKLIREWCIDTWIMSCRVLSRHLERAVFHEIVVAAQADEAQRIIGIYIPTERNGLVREHYKKLGFEYAGQSDDGRSQWSYDLADYQATDVPIQVERDY